MVEVRFRVWPEALTAPFRVKLLASVKLIPPEAVLLTAPRLPSKLAPLRVMPFAAKALSVPPEMTPPVWLMAPPAALSDVVAPEMFPVSVRSPVSAIRSTKVPPLMAPTERLVALVKVKPVTAVNAPIGLVRMASSKLALAPTEPVSVSAVMIPPAWLIEPLWETRFTV